MLTLESGCFPVVLGVVLIFRTLPNCQVIIKCISWNSSYKHFWIRSIVQLLCLSHNKIRQREMSLKGPLHEWRVITQRTIGPFLTCGDSYTLERWTLAVNAKRSIHTLYGRRSNSSLSQMPLWEQRKVLGKEYVGGAITCSLKSLIVCAILPYSLSLNKLLNPEPYYLFIT